ncbi:MAG: hypothetical protein J1F64_01620 [Oscillospiraceae bacterium]|nr:hypothetical protein [Oscillospiraceae bacterium]
MDINAAMSLQAMAENNPYKPRNSGNKGGKDFEQIFREASALKSEKKDLKNNGGLQESYSAVFNAGNAAVNPIDRINRIND